MSSWFAAAGTEETRAAVADVMSAWTEEEREACREFLAMAADVELPA